MEKFRVFITDPAKKNMEKLDHSEQERIEKILQQLYEKGDEVGKPLRGLRFLREKKFDGKRLYYLVYSDWSSILVVAVSDKKTQEATINQIALEGSQYRAVALDLLRTKGII